MEALRELMVSANATGAGAGAGGAAPQAARRRRARRRLSQLWWDDAFASDGWDWDEWQDQQARLWRDAREELREQEGHAARARAREAAAREKHERAWRAAQAQRRDEQRATEAAQRKVAEAAAKRARREAAAAAAPAAQQAAAAAVAGTGSTATAAAAQQAAQAAPPPAEAPAAPPQASQPQARTRITPLRDAAAAAASLVPPGSGGFAAAFTARPQSRHTIVLPSLALGAPFEAGAALPGLDFDGSPWALQRALVGGAAAAAGVGGEATLEALGSAQGWLNASALAPAGGGGGVQFQLGCERCWLLLDGVVVAGTRDGVSTSGCVALPAGGGGGDGDAWPLPQLLVHAEVQFAAKSLPVAGVRLLRRACAAGGGESVAPFEPLGAALAPGMVASAADVEGGGYVEGLICEVALAGEPAAAAQARAGRAAGERIAHARATVFVPRAPGVPGAGGLHPASARRFSANAAQHSAAAAFGNAALNVSAAAAVATGPPAEEDGEPLEEEEAKEQAERRRAAAAHAGGAPPQQALPLPPLAVPGDDALGPLTALLNSLLSGWWEGGRQLRSAPDTPAGPPPARRARALRQAPEPEAPPPPATRESRLLSFSPEELAPGLVASHAPGARFDVRCWGFWNGSLAANASIGADPSRPLAGAEVRVGGARLAARPAAPSLVAAVGIESVLTNWEERRAAAEGGGFAARGGGVDWGAPGRRGYAAAAGGGFRGGADGGLLRLLTMEWRGVGGGSALWVADARGPWELAPRELWVPPQQAGSRSGGGGGKVLE